MIRRWLVHPFRHALHQVETWLNGCTQPNSNSLLLGTASDLIAENAFLRQQVIVLKRQTPRPRLIARDRALLVVLASKGQGWKDALLLVKPETWLKWHRAGFRLFGGTSPRGKPAHHACRPKPSPSSKTWRSIIGYGAQNASVVKC
jgi:hypothetical protein